MGCDGHRPVGSQAGSPIGQELSGASQSATGQASAPRTPVPVYVSLLSGFGGCDQQLGGARDAIIPKFHPAGDSINTLSVDIGSLNAPLVWLTIANSFVGDFLLRQKVSTNLNQFYVLSSPLIRPTNTSVEFQTLLI